MTSVFSTFHTAVSAVSAASNVTLLKINEHK